MSRLTNLVARRLFPGAAPFEQIRNTRVLALALFLGSVFSALFGCLLYIVNQQNHF